MRDSKLILHIQCTELMHACKFGHAPNFALLHHHLSPCSHTGNPPPLFSSIGSIDLTPAQRVERNTPRRDRDGGYGTAKACVLAGRVRL
jgi:hypothetical protein